MYIANSIILSAGLFSSLYLCSETLKVINMYEFENKKMSSRILILNKLLFITSCSLFLYTFAAVHRVIPFELYLIY